MRPSVVHVVPFDAQSPSRHLPWRSTVRGNDKQLTEAILQKTRAIRTVLQSFVTTRGGFGPFRATWCRGHVDFPGLSDPRASIPNAIDLPVW